MKLYMTKELKELVKSFLKKLLQKPFIRYLEV